MKPEGPSAGLSALVADNRVSLHRNAVPTFDEVVAVHPREASTRRSPRVARCRKCPACHIEITETGHGILRVSKKNRHEEMIFHGAEDARDQPYTAPVRVETIQKRPDIRHFC